MADPGALGQGGQGQCPPGSTDEDYCPEPPKECDRLKGKKRAECLEDERESRATNQRCEKLARSERKACRNGAARIEQREDM